MYGSVGANTIFRSRRVGILMSLLVIGPLSFFPKLDSLKHTSFISGLMYDSIVHHRFASVLLVWIHFILLLLCKIPLFHRILSLVGLIFMYSLHSKELDPCANFSSVLDCVGEFHVSQLILVSTYTITLFAQLGEQELFIVNMDTLKSIPIMIFSFSCQQNTFAVVNELHHPTQKRCPYGLLPTSFWLILSKASISLIALGWTWCFWHLVVLHWCCIS